MLRAAIRYVVPVFALGFLFGTLRQFVLLDTIGLGWSIALELPVMILASFAFAYGAMIHCRISNLGRAMAMGLIAFAMLMAAELATATLLLGQTPQRWLVMQFRYPGWLGLFGQILFGCAPMILSLSGATARLHRPRSRRRHRAIPDRPPPRPAGTQRRRRSRKGRR